LLSPIGNIDLVVAVGDCGNGENNLIQSDATDLQNSAEKSSGDFIGGPNRRYFGERNAGGNMAATKICGAADG
jgi:hypothetical protein